jgi:hypothetical protein
MDPDVTPTDGPAIGLKGFPVGTNACEYMTNQQIFMILVSKSDIDGFFVPFKHIHLL